MKLNKLIVAFTLILPSHFAFANGEAPKQAQVQQISEEDVVTALTVLIQAGVLQVKDGQIVVKAPSALDQLRASGRAQVERAASDSICL